MKLSPSQALVEYGHVILPSLAAVIGLAALTSQWVENHRLRGEIEKLNGERASTVQMIQNEVKKAEDKNHAYTKDLNKWIDDINHFAGRMNAKIGSVKQNAQQVMDQRNAQNIVAMYQAGEAAGINWTGTTKEASIQAVVMGGSPAEGVFAGKVFMVPNLTAPAQAGAARFIEFADGELSYVRPPEPVVAEVDEPEVLPMMPKLPEP